MKKSTFLFGFEAIKIFILLNILIISNNLTAQVRVPFTPRVSQNTPNTTIYHVKGDFTLIGNTNLTLTNYGNNTNNSNNNMQYVDVDGDANTFNSSSANLTYSTENGAVPQCSKVVFAGLYWTGRASDGSSSPDIFNVTKGGITKTFNKRKVKLKGPNTSSYTEITANTNDIYYPTNSDGFMYSAFAEITDYVKNNGLGQYTVADIALVEGNGGSTGYYGGWGIIVVYENSRMKWRDITIFDGHAYVQGSTTTNHQIPISGFNAVQTGAVNVKLGLMAGEGDIGISGDYFNILRSSDNNWQTLNHSGNTTNNFFNGSIQTGGNTRNPNLQNNTGLDISMFNISNPNNSVIANNQTSTTLRYGSTQDTYVIFMAAFAVDAYIPDAEGVMSLITINGNPPSGSLTVQPGEEIEYSIKILNEGTEPVNNTQIKIQIPYTTNFVTGSESGVINFTPLPTPNNLYFNPTLGGNGTLIWDIGTLPVPALSTEILGELKFKVKVTEDCFLLKNPNCNPSVPLYGYLSGVGGITGIVFNDKPFIQGYETTGLCIGDPITDPIILNIDSTDYINQNCQDTVTNLSFTFCDTNSIISFGDISSNFPSGTHFYNSYPITSSTIEYTSSNTFPSTIGTTQYYAVPPLANGCYFIFTIIVIDSPIITGPPNSNIDGCNLNAISPLIYSEIPVNISLSEFINAGGTVSDSSLNYNISYVDSSSGTCPILINRTFTVISNCSNSTFIQSFTIQDTTPPTIDIVAADLTVECDGNGNTADLQAWLTSNGGASSTDACSNVTWSNDYSALSDDCGATGSVTVTFTATDDCGNSSSSSATFTIQDTTAPTIDILASDLTVECDGNGNTADLQAWLASNGGASSTDACSNVTWSNDYSALSDDCGATGSVTVTFTATDDCGNSSTSSATFTIEDTTAPTIDIVAADLTVECDGNGNTADLQAWLAANGGASASDSCSNVTWSNDYTALSDDCGATGSVTVTFTATDDCGNSSTSSATFTIQDTTAPTIAIAAADLTVECDGNGNTADLQAWLAANGGASSSDACSSVTWSNNYSSLSDDCGATGSVSVTFTATDDCGNSSSSSATFTIQDTTAPTIDIVAADLTVECDGNGNTADLQAWLASNGGASSSDACSNVTWSNNYASLSDDCGATGSVSVTFTATDDCGNSSSSSATFTIQDTTAPTIDIVASDLTVECDGNGNAADLQAWLAANGGASASDSCSSVTWSNDFSSVSNECGATGSVSVTFTATDDCGNSSSSSATFTIVDTTAPTIAIVAADLTVECDGNGNTADLQAWLASNGGASSSDACSSVTWSNNYSSLSDDCSATGSVSVTFTATDDCGNSASSSATFTIQDTTNPEFTSNLPSDVSVSCDNVPTAETLTASDNCSSNATVVVDDEIITDESACAGEYIILRTWTATDDCGNFITYTQTISVYDNTTPVLDTPYDEQIEVNCSEIPDVPQLEFSDNCSGVASVDYNENTTTISIYEYYIEREWLVSDNCGNFATYNQTIHVNVDQPFNAIPFSICTDEEPINLFTILDDSLPTNGEWIEVTNSGGLNGNMFDPNGVATGYYTIQYIVTLENNACPSKFEIYLNVNVDCVVLPACDIVIYNAVSPNNDGSNDIFVIDGIECYPNNTVEIYNRWGILVYETKGYDNLIHSFKGYSEGRTTLNKNELLPDGTYFYILNYRDEEGKTHDKSGYLYLNK